MKLCTFTEDGRTRIGVVDGDRVADITRVDADIPTDMIGLLTAGAPALDKARAAMEAAPRLALAAVHLEAPVQRPGKFLAIGLNYIKHIDEMGLRRPGFPSCFVKLNTCLIGPYDRTWLPGISDSYDYEGELGVVIGKRCRRVTPEQAADVIGGYFVVNDLTVRAWVEKSPQVTLAKSFDTAGPFGPWIVTPDEVGDPQDLRLRTWVNGDLRQDSHTSDMLFSCVDLVSILSQGMTLEPGDLISTGTPSGVGQGFDPPRYLKAGDRVKVEIERIGMIENEVIEEPADSVFR